MKSNFSIIGLLAVAAHVLPAQSLPVKLTTANDVFGIVNPGAYGASPLALVSGDFNKDGKQDLVTISNGNPASAAFAPGNGDGTFGTPVTIASFSSGPLAVVAGDFNKDGNFDVAFMGSQNGNSPGYVSVYLGNGAGGFNLSATYNLGNTGYGWQGNALAAADVNKDGKLDLIAVNQSDITVSVALGNGDGTFKTPTTYPIGGGYNANFLAAAIGDINGDGKPDLVMAGYYGGNGILSVLLGTGGGLFGSAMVTLGANNYWSSPYGAQLADLNGDHKLDLVVADEQGATVFLGNGDGTFGSPVNYGTPSGNAASVAIADVNKDHKLDLVVSNIGYEGVNFSTVSVFLGNGNGTFQKPQGYTTEVTPTSVVLADFNNDGNLDFATGSDNSNSAFTVALGNGDGTFQAGPNYGAEYVFDNGFVSADFNGDGNLDMALARADGTIEIYEGTSHGTFAATAITTNLVVNNDGAEVLGWNPFGSTFTASGLKAADMNGDGKADLVAVVQFNGGVQQIGVLLGQGNGTFATPAYYSIGDTSGQPEIALGDFNGDGKPDVAVTNADGTLSILINSGSGVLETPILYPSTVPGDQIPLVADFNGDGKLDIAVPGGCPGDIYILLGNGNGTFGSPVTSGLSVCANAAAAGDFNNDGKPDLAIGGSSYNGLNSPIQILLNNGNGTFSAAGTPRGASGNCSPVGPFSLAAGDLNQDGLLDLVVALNFTADSDGYHQWPCGADLGVQVWTGNGDGTLSQNTANTPFLAGENDGGAIVADFNKDGMPDVAVLNGQAQGCCTNPPSYFTILLNRTQPESFSPDALAFATQPIHTSSKAQSVVLTNDTTSTLSLTNLAITGSGASDFSLANECPILLGAGLHCTLNVTFAPTISGPLAASITGVGTASVALTGTATQLELSATKLNFGSEPVGDTSSPQTITVTNEGSIAVRFTGMGIAIGGADAKDYKQTNNCGTSLAASSSCTITVTFTPTTTGTRTATLDLNDNGGGSPQKVSLTGSGT
jgi:hypothetical protein